MQILKNSLFYRFILLSQNDLTVISSYLFSYLIEIYLFNRSFFISLRYLNRQIFIASDLLSQKSSFFNRENFMSCQEFYKLVYFFIE